MQLPNRLISSEQDNLKELALSPPKDSSTELTAERVAEALQDLRQDLWRAHLERVTYFLIYECVIILWVSSRHFKGDIVKLL